MYKQWWIDYLEADFVAKRKIDLEMILNHAEPNREMIVDMINLKTEIKALNDTKVPESPQYMAELQESIMNKIKCETPTPPTKASPKSSPTPPPRTKQPKPKSPKPSAIPSPSPRSS